ncbi:hypothetical protein A3Q56_01141 [Intoshia linei]|uniref:Uncharacterized protein n=1 Tax=Intoshia linei TaxID=1819745 RepID=A0A177BA38_9BILA|nr:hypothetical protein A3Q56_01141 [Intoshia linei]
MYKPSKEHQKFNPAYATVQGNFSLLKYKPCIPKRSNSTKISAKINMNKKYPKPDYFYDTIQNSQTNKRDGPVYWGLKLSLGKQIKRHFKKEKNLNRMSSLSSFSSNSTYSSIYSGISNIGDVNSPVVYQCCDSVHSTVSGYSSMSLSQKNVIIDQHRLNKDRIRHNMRGVQDEAIQRQLFREIVSRGGENHSTIRKKLPKPPQRKTELSSPHQYSTLTHKLKPEFQPLTESENIYEHVPHVPVEQTFELPPPSLEMLSLTISERPLPAIKALSIPAWKQELINKRNNTPKENLRKPSAFSEQLMEKLKEQRKKSEC